LQQLKFTSSSKLVLCALAGMLLGAHACMAEALSFAGAFQYDTDVQFFTFTVTAATPDVSLRTYS
jgi:hypothetical protein